MKEQLVSSAIINSTRDELIRGNTSSVEDFWIEIGNKGAPIIESIEGDIQNNFITFVYKGDDTTKNVVVIGAFPGFDYTQNQMDRLLDTDIWYKTYKVRNDIRFIYYYSVNDALDTDMEKRSKNVSFDMLNDNKFIFVKNENKIDSKEITASVVELVNAESQEWAMEKAEVPKGSIECFTLESEILNNSRRIWVYLPFRYSEENSPNNLLILSDGFEYTNLIPTPTILDNLIYRNKISSTAAVFIGSTEARNKELACNDSFIEFIVSELLPSLYLKYNITKDPSKTVIAGSSLGGLNAIYAGLRYPDVFGKVLSQSGSFWWKPENESDSNWLINKIKNAERLPESFYLEVGVLENSNTMINSNENLAAALKNIGCKMKYSQFGGGHAYLSWRGTLSEGLMWILNH